VPALAPSDQMKAALQTRLTPRALGIFGAPTFATGEALFWGDDRLIEAIALHRWTV
jgi:2-hydroxychromene-2-carboxylate isomerase